MSWILKIHIFDLLFIPGLNLVNLPLKPLLNVSGIL